MFLHVATAFAGATLTVAAAWCVLGRTALLLAPLGASLASLAVCLLILGCGGRLVAGARRALPQASGTLT